MYPVLFKIGSLTFYSHGLLAVLGIIAGAWFLYYLAKKEKLNREYLFDNLVYSVLFGIVGARLTYFFLYPDQFVRWQEVFFLWNGGMVSYGGFIAGGIAFYLLLKSQKQDIAKWFDLSAIGFSLGLCFGRIGNLLAGEYSGVSTDKFSIGGVVPVTFYEAILLLLIFALTLLGYRLKKKVGLSKGQLFAVFMILYGLGRFIIDFWRDEKIALAGLSLGQFVSLAVLSLGLYLSIRFLCQKRGANDSQ